MVPAKGYLSYEAGKHHQPLACGKCFGRGGAVGVSNRGVTVHLQLQKGKRDNIIAIEDILVRYWATTNGILFPLVKAFDDVDFAKHTPGGLHQGSDISKGCSVRVGLDFILQPVY